MASTNRPSKRGLPEFIDNLPDTLNRALSARSPRMRGIRIEEFKDGEDYVVRAELPGVDPERDIDLEVVDRFLRIRAERRTERRDRCTSEFRYGTLTRQVALPDGANESQVSASYREGILEIRIPVRERRSERRAIPVQRAG
jgi:HSP20 family molecular chaperone IbpA